MTDICGGLVFSTVVKLDLSRMAKEYPRMHIALGARILTAYATMFARILLVTSILILELFWVLSPFLFVMSVMTYLAALLFLVQDRRF